MMIQPATANACMTDPSPPAACSGIQEHKTYSFAVTRMMGLDTAAAMLGGKAKLADALAITVRALSYKLTAERGISNLDLEFAAKALDAEARRLTDHARKLRDVAADRQDVR